MPFSGEVSPGKLRNDSVVDSQLTAIAAGLSLGVGVSLGVLLGILASVAVVIYCMMCRKKRQSANTSMHFYFLQ